MTAGVARPIEMVLVDGRLRSALDAWDRGLHFGDGVFETLPVLCGRGVPHWPLHYKRLQAGCARLGLRCPADALLQREIAQIRPQRERQVIKLILTRGSGPRGYRCPEDARERRILLASEWPDYPDSYARDGVELRLCETRLGRNPALAGIKHCNRLEQVLARREWAGEAAEGLMRDSAGWVIEGTMSNVFLVEGAALRTPALSQCGVAGIARERILRWAAEQRVPATVADLDVDAVRRADGVFLCNSVIGVWPVRAFADRIYAIPDLALRIRDMLQGHRP